MSDELPAATARPSVRVVGAWWREAIRSAFLLRASWAGLHPTPGTVAYVIVLLFLAKVLLERLYIAGDATFYWPAVFIGWLGIGVRVWLCWLLVSLSSSRADVPPPPGTAALFTMLGLQILVVEVVLAFLFVPMTHAGWLVEDRIGVTGLWVVWLATMLWITAAQSKLIWQARRATRGLRIVVIVALPLLLVFEQWARPAIFWYPVEATERSARDRSLSLTQERLEQQALLLPGQLRALTGERPGVVDVYAITYAPYADDEVFRKESAMVADVMEERFGAQGRTVQLVNHMETIGDLPWATPANLKRTIEKMATLMNRDEDVLFVHLTSHGGSDGVLSTRLWPLRFGSLTPGELKTWLDEAGIHYRVVSVSACFSGSWIAPLVDDGTLVMTAADADHTSYGCGRGSELTYFGRAMFDEQLRKTWSFEDAHAAARLVIDERERAAGKKDGYSNPQIDVGASIRERLARLADERAHAPTP